MSRCQDCKAYSSFSTQKVVALMISNALSQQLRKISPKFLESGKSEKITAFGGIFFVLDKFDSILSSVIDSHLGLRSRLIGYQCNMGTLILRSDRIYP